MQQKLIFVFVRSAGVLLLITALAKLISGVGSAPILQWRDPVLNVPFRYLFFALGGIEFLVAMICFRGKNVRIQTALVAWLSTNFIIYRLGLLWVGYHKLCSCLGNLTDALNIQPQTADAIMKTILCYLLIGSYVGSFVLWKENLKARAVAPYSAK
jgi:hypothetical protein